MKLEYQNILEKLDEMEGQKIIGAFDKRTIIELSSDVMKGIMQKYENVAGWEIAAWKYSGVFRS